MAREWVIDALWHEIEPLLPKRPPPSTGGRPLSGDRVCLVAILFVRSGGPPCWQRF